MTRAREIGIGGAGIAGLALAILLRRAGARVVVFDRLETPAPIGSGLILQPVGLAVLDAMGLGTRIRDLGAPIEKLFGRNETGHVVLDVRYAAAPARLPALAVHRGALFETLLDGAREEGVEIDAGREIRSVTAPPRRAFAFADGTHSAAFDLLVDGLGARSPLAEKPFAPLAYGALWASLAWPEEGGFDPAALEQRYEGARKMAGVLPIGRLPRRRQRMAAYFWSLRHDAFEAWRAAPIEAWKREALSLWPATAAFLDQIERHEDLVFARYAHRTLSRPAAEEIVHIGDAYRCASPQLGQGANMALLDAFALSCALDEHEDVAAALASQVRRRRLHTWIYQTASYLFTPFYQSDSRLAPFVRDRIVAPLSRVWPAPQILGALVSGAIGAPLSRLCKEMRSDRRPSALSKARA